MTAHLHMSEMRVTAYHLRNVRNRPEGQPDLKDNESSGNAAIT